MNVEEIWFTSGDGTRLEGELARADHARAAVVLCHPHPQYGGSMRAGLVGDLFRALPPMGVTALRFNYRGVERSDGAWDAGDLERADTVAALDALVAAAPLTVPVFLVGWSFGADMALSVHDSRVAGWCAIAPPLHFAAGLDPIGADVRPKRLVLGERDDIVSADRIRDVANGWRNVSVEVIPGASHYFVGKTGAVVNAVLAFAEIHHA